MGRMSTATARKPFEPRPMKGADVLPIKRKPAARTDNRFATINAFLDLCVSDLTRVESLVWLTLWRHERNGSVAISSGFVATAIGASRRAVTEAIRTLKDKRLIEIIHHGGLSGDINRYRLRLPPTASP